MTKTVKERLLNTLITLATVIIASLIVVKVCFAYTKKYHNENSETLEIVKKLDYLIQKVERLDR